MRSNVIGKIFQHHIAVVVGQDQASHYLLQSFHIGLACALLKAGKSLPRIQALLR